MEVRKIKPTGTLVLQFNAGQEIEVIVNNGIMYAPVVPIGVAEATAAKTNTKKAAEKEEEAEEEKPAAKKPSSRSKKAAAADEEEEKPAAKKKTAKKEADGDRDAVVKILEDLDSGELPEKKGVAKLQELNEDADDAAIAKTIKDFMKDEDSEIEDVADKIMAIFSGEEADDEKPAKKGSSKKKEADDEKPAKKSSKKKADPEGEEIAIDDAADELEKGDEIAVHWPDETNEEGEYKGTNWFKGTVKSIKKGKVAVEYEDGTEGEINEEDNDKIIKLEE